MKHETHSSRPSRSSHPSRSPAPSRSSGSLRHSRFPAFSRTAGSARPDRFPHFRLRPTATSSRSSSRPAIVGPSGSAGSRTAFGAGLAAGAIAAGLGAGVFAVLVMVLWVGSPYPDSGPGGALRVAAALWLLAHGVELVRIETLSGAPAPVGLTPLLLLVAPVFVVHRAARDAVHDASASSGRPDSTDIPAASGSALPVGAGVVLGYAGVGAAVALYASGGALRPSLPWVCVCVPAVAAGAAALGVWTAYGHSRETLERFPDWAVVAGRAAGAGVAVLVGGGALLVAVALGLHAGAAWDSVLRLAEVWSGRAAVLLLCLVLLPNAAVWGAAYGVGAGFVLGGAEVRGMPVPSGAVTGGVPEFPLLVAVDRVPGTVAEAASGAPAVGQTAVVSAWAVLLVPVAAGAAVGWLVGRHGGGAGWARGRVAGVTALAGALCGATMAGLGALSAGRLGTGALAHVGPLWWQVGGAVLAWVAAVGVPVGVGAHALGARRTA